jgi:hypothetical protein
MLERLCIVMTIVADVVIRRYLFSIEVRGCGLTSGLRQMTRPFA